jgi:hypothetical protein
VPGGGERIPAADGTRVGTACVCGGAIMGDEKGPGDSRADPGPGNGPGSDVVRLGGMAEFAGLADRVGSEA